MHGYHFHSSITFLHALLRSCCATSPRRAFDSLAREDPNGLAPQKITTVWRLRHARAYRDFLHRHFSHALYDIAVTGVAQALLPHALAVGHAYLTTTYPSAAHLPYYSLDMGLPSRQTLRCRTGEQPHSPSPWPFSSTAACRCCGSSTTATLCRRLRAGRVLPSSF